MKIILDDRRDFPKGNYNCVRCYKDCTMMLSIFRELEYISLDYDIGEEHTGLDVLVYMKEKGVKVEHINIHSDHKLGVPKMREYAEQHFHETSLTFNSL